MSLRQAALRMRKVYCNFLHYLSPWDASIQFFQNTDSMSTGGKKKTLERDFILTVPATPLLQLIKSSKIHLFLQKVMRVKNSIGCLE